MQSETLKYLYLLFEDDTVVPLSSMSCLCMLLHFVAHVHFAEYVFNTEVRPDSATSYASLLTSPRAGTPCPDYQPHPQSKLLSFGGRMGVHGTTPRL